MSNVPGLFVLGEANFSDHGANRLGASALMQGWRMATSSCRRRFPAIWPPRSPTSGPRRTPGVSCVRRRLSGLTSVGFCYSRARGHRIISTRNWAGSCGNTAAWPAPVLDWRPSGCCARCARVSQSPRLGRRRGWNQSLEGGRVGDFIELGELMCRDALMREESCGGHFREEYQYTNADPEVQQGLVNPGDVKRRDDQFAFVAAWGTCRRRPGSRPEQRNPSCTREVKMSTRATNNPSGPREPESRRSNHEGEPESLAAENTASGGEFGRTSRRN